MAAYALPSLVVLVAVVFAAFRMQSGAIAECEQALIEASEESDPALRTELLLEAAETAKHAVFGWKACMATAHLRLARIKEAQGELSTAIVHFQEAVAYQLNETLLPAALESVATLLSKQGRHVEAVPFAERLVATPGPHQTSMVRWAYGAPVFASFLQRMARGSMRRQQLKSAASTGRILPEQIQEVERRDASELSVQEFFTKYAMQSRPVVISGGMDALASGADDSQANYTSRLSWQEEWSINNLKRRCGRFGQRFQAKPFAADGEDTSVLSFLEAFEEQRVPTRKVKRKGSSGGGFEIGVDGVEREVEEEEEPLYLFDWPLPLHCPAMLRSFRVPGYFANDYLQRVVSAINRINDYTSSGW
jgi:hypothetical protein